MRKDVQEIFKATPHEKQVMMFSATLSTEMRAVCKKFMQDPMEIYVDDSKLTLHGLQQHYVKLAENEKNRKLNELLDALEFNQVVVFVKSVSRATALDKLLQVNLPPCTLVSCSLPVLCSLLWCLLRVRDRPCSDLPLAGVQLPICGYPWIYEARRTD